MAGEKDAEEFWWVFWGGATHLFPPNTTATQFPSTELPLNPIRYWYSKGVQQNSYYAVNNYHT